MDFTSLSHSAVLPFFSMSAVPIQIARRRASLAKRGLLFAAVAAFGATIGLARSSHSATAATSSTSTLASRPSSGSNSFGQAEVSPATTSQTPSVSTGAS
jgi:hypothetical protein